MPTIQFDNKQFALLPLSFEDMELIEAEAAAAASKTAVAKLETLHRLRIAVDELAIFETATGNADLDFVTGFAGRSYVLWLSVRKALPELSLADFRHKCPAKEYRKYKALLDEAMGVGADEQEEKPIPPHEKYKQMEAQENRRYGIFNALCEGENITPQQLADMEIHNIVPLFCKYSGTNKCDPDKLRGRIIEYLEAFKNGKANDEDGAAGAAIPLHPKPNEPSGEEVIEYHAKAG